MLRVIKTEYSLNQQIHHENNIKCVFLHVNVLTNVVRKIDFFNQPEVEGQSSKEQVLKGLLCMVSPTESLFSYTIIYANSLGLCVLFHRFTG